MPTGGSPGRKRRGSGLLPAQKDKLRDLCRRERNQLNCGEDRHKLARAVFHGRRGELRQRYREGQEDQLSALGMVVNIIVLWNTLYMDAALEQLRHEGFRINRRTKPGSPLWFSTTSICSDVTPFPFLSRSAEVSSGLFETPEIRWKRPLSRMTSATLPVYVSRLSEFSSIAPDYPIMTIPDKRERMPYSPSPRARRFAPSIRQIMCNPRLPILNLPYCVVEIARRGSRFLVKTGTRGLSNSTANQRRGDSDHPGLGYYGAFSTG